MSADPSETIHYWRQKCYELEKIIKTLSAHCFQVVEKHEELLANYKKNQEQYRNLVQKLKDKGEQIKRAKDVLEPITVEYQALRDKYEIAVQCQYEAENYASQVNKKNKVLTRQSQMLLNKLNVTEINLEDELVEETSDEVDHFKELDKRIIDLSEDKTALTAQVKKLHEEFELEKSTNVQLSERVETLKEELKQARLTITKQEATLQALAKTSEEACKEYEELQDQFDQEYTGRTQVEKIAHNLYAEREAARRQSAMLMKDIGNNQKLMEALIEVENVTTKMEVMKAAYEQKVKDLENEIKSLKENSGLNSLESKILSLIHERDSVLQTLAETESASQELRSQYSLLTRQYEDLEKKYDNVTSAARPPPPPPPPPPPLVSKTGGFLAKITGGKRKKIEQQFLHGGVEVKPEYSKAVDEMMKRIKQGNIGLRPVLKKRTKSCPEEEEDGKAMKELQNILNKMKKARSEEDLCAIEESTLDENSELARAFKRIQKSKQEKSSERPKPAPAPRSKLPSIKDDHE